MAAIEDLVGHKADMIDGPFGSNLKTEHYTDAGPRVIRLQNIGDGIFIDGQAHISEERYAALSKHQVRAGDVLIASLGESLPRSCLAPEGIEPAIVKADCLRVRPAAGVCSAYLMYAMNSPSVRGLVSSMIRGVGRPRINLSHIRALEIPVPPSKEQERIAAELDRRLSRVDAASRSLNLVRLKVGMVRRSILEGLTRGTLLGGDDADWTPSTTGEIADVRGGIQKQPMRKPINHRYPFLRVANVGRGTLDLSEVHEIELFEGELERYALEVGDLLVVEGNGSIDQIGRAALWDGSILNCVHQNHLIRVRPSNAVLPEFLALVWNSPSTIQQLRAISSSTSGLNTLSTGKIKRVLVRIPNLDTQAALVADAERRLSVIESAAKSVEVGLRRCAQLRQSFLCAALTGQLIRQDPLDESSDVLLEAIRAAREKNEPLRQSRRRQAERRT